MFSVSILSFKSGFWDSGLKTFLWIACMFAFLPAFAQKEVNGSEREKMIGQVCLAAGQLQSLQCDFVQVKQLSLLKTDMTSTGKMYYKGGQLLRWEYLTPYTYTFVLNHDRVMLKSSQKTDVIDVRSSKMFQQIARIMMNSVTGKCLTDEKDFQVSMYVEKNEWIAQLTPQQKELAQMFARVLLHINPQSQMVTMVELLEKSGDSTRIEMKNVQKNGTIDDDLFAVK